MYVDRTRTAETPPGAAYHFPAPRPGGGIGRHKRLKISREFLPCRFESGPGHIPPDTAQSGPFEPLEAVQVYLCVSKKPLEKLFKIREKGLKREAIMQHKILLGVGAFFFLIGGLMVGPQGSLQEAFAKPPKWAPAHGYRRKHEDGHKHKHKHKHEARTYESRENSYSWTYSRIDVNNDGRISLSEWNESKELFIILDRNRDGYVSPTEYAGIDEQRGLISGLLAKVKEKVGSFWGWLF